MAEKLRRIPFDEFARDITRFFKLVIQQHEPVVVENEEGERVVIRPLPPTTPKRTMTEEEYKAFRSALGGWADVDTDSLKKAIYQSRRSSRPPVEL
jgi:hypothetical protein